jgi:hypothetical protein
LRLFRRRFLVLAGGRLGLGGNQHVADMLVRPVAAVQLMGLGSHGPLAGFFSVRVIIRAIFRQQGNGFVHA